MQLSFLNRTQSLSVLFTLVNKVFWKKKVHRKKSSPDEWPALGASPDGNRPHTVLYVFNKDFPLKCSTKSRNLCHVIVKKKTSGTYTSQV